MAVLNGLKKLLTTLCNSSWIVKMRWSFFLLSIIFWVVMIFFSYPNFCRSCSATNRGLSVAFLAIPFGLNCLSFIWFSVKIVEPKERSFKGPAILPDNILTDMVLSLVYMAIPILIFSAGPQTLARAVTCMLFVPIAAFFTFAAAPDTGSEIINLACGVSIAQIISTRKVNQATNNSLTYVWMGVSLFFIGGCMVSRVCLAIKVGQAVSASASVASS